MNRKKLIWIGLAILFFLSGMGLIAGIEKILNLNGLFLSVTANTNSMHPYLKPNCFFLYKPFEFISSDNFSLYLTTENIKKNVKIGDVIIFRYEKPVNVIHRVIDKCIFEAENETWDYGVITKGDNNKDNDGCIPWWAVTGKLAFKFC